MKTLDLIGRRHLRSEISARWVEDPDNARGCAEFRPGDPFYDEAEQVCEMAGVQANSYTTAGRVCLAGFTCWVARNRRGGIEFFG